MGQKLRIVLVAALWVTVAVGVLKVGHAAAGPGEAGLDEGPARVQQEGVQEREANLSVEQRVDKIFAAYDNTRSPGCSLGVIQDGEFVLKRGYGMGNLEFGAPLSPESVFRIGSTSKQFTAASIVLLAEEGKLSLDDDVRQYIHELPEFDPPVTIRQLVHHTSGYRDYLTLMDLAGKRDADYYTDEDLLEMLSRQRQLNFMPSSRYTYSNTGYWLLSQLVKRTSGLSLREFAAEKIFEPLGMENTHFHDDHTEIVPDRAYGYAPTEDGSYVISMTTLPMIGDGGVFTTVEDLFHWDQNFYGPAIGGPEFLEQMLTRGVLNDGEVLDYAFGLGHGTYRGLKTVSHGGSFVGFRAEMVRFPDERFTVICLCNRGDANPTRLSYAVADVYLEEQLEPVVGTGGDDEGAAGEEDTEGKPFVPKPEELAELVGDYYSEELDVTYALRVEGQGLALESGLASELSGSSGIIFAPVEADVVKYRFLTLRFQRDSAGRVSGFELDAGRVTNLSFTRLP